MSLLYYQFDVSGFSAEERQSVASALDMRAYTGCIFDAKNRDRYYAFFPESEDPEILKKYFPVFEKCRITRSLP